MKNAQETLQKRTKISETQEKRMRNTFDVRESSPAHEKRMENASDTHKKALHMENT